jgi:prolyl 4-hydroxylase
LLYIHLHNITPYTLRITLLNTKNYTELGFKKIKAPEAAFKLIKDFWETNKHQGKPEKWNVGYTYTNHWITNSTMVSVEDPDMIGGGWELKKEIWDMAQDTITEWVGRPLQTSSLYGIRVYHEGAILATHVDRLPLVCSAIINVDQDPDMEGDWPLEVYGHDGRVYNVSMEPGDMVLYESHSLLHGRPFALPGKHYANIFIHFEPVPLENTARLAQLGDLDALKQAAAEDHPSLFQMDDNRWEPLHEAVRADHLEVARYLLEQGANVNAYTNGGHLPLDWAVKSGASEDMIHLLKENGGVTGTAHTEFKHEQSESGQDEF